jgi:hypothetical protein
MLNIRVILLSRGLESYAGDVVIDAVIEDGQRTAEPGRGVPLAGGGQRSEQAVAELGAKDRDALPFCGPHAGVSVLDPADEPVEAQAAQVVSHLAVP